MSPSHQTLHEHTWNERFEVGGGDNGSNNNYGCDGGRGGGRDHDDGGGRGDCRGYDGDGGNVFLVPNWIPS